MIIWIIGMSSSGKTTLSSSLFKQLKESCRHLVLLDGDVLRQVFGNDTDHTIDGRRKNAERISKLCKFLDTQGIHVIAAVLSIFPEWQEWNRKNFENYFEVFLDIPLETLKKRDEKSLYKDAEAGLVDNVVGIDIPFPHPVSSDLVIDLDQQKAGVDKCIEAILSRIPPLD